MKIDFSTWSASDYAAWWGAIIATSALIWNAIVAYRSGARIQVRITSGMMLFPRQPVTLDKEWISIKAINRGTSPTTVTLCCGYYAKNYWHRLIGKKKSFIIKCHVSLGDPVPYKLNPGEEWFNMADQEPIKKELSNGLLYMGISHNQKKRPIYKRVRFRE